MNERIPNKQRSRWLARKIGRHTAIAKAERRHRTWWNRRTLGGQFKTPAHNPLPEPLAPLRDKRKWGRIIPGVDV